MHFSIRVSRRCLERHEAGTASPGMQLRCSWTISARWDSEAPSTQSSPLRAADGGIQFAVMFTESAPTGGILYAKVLM